MVTIRMNTIEQGGYIAEEWNASTFVRRFGRSPEERAMRDQTFHLRTTHASHTVAQLLTVMMNSILTLEHWAGISKNLGKHSSERRKLLVGGVGRQY